MATQPKRQICYEGHYLMATEMVAYKATITDAEGDFICDILGDAPAEGLSPEHMNAYVDGRMRAAIAVEMSRRR